jgi:hypothetical protein
MTITQHKALVAAIPEDLKEGEAIEVSDDGESWAQIKFVGYGYAGIMGPFSRHQWRYARRPAPALPVEDRAGNDLGTAPAVKRLKDEPWPENEALRFRAVSHSGNAWSYGERPNLRTGLWWVSACATHKLLGRGYDPTDWQNSLEERPAPAPKIKDPLSGSRYGDPIAGLLPDDEACLNCGERDCICMDHFADTSEKERRPPGMAGGIK